MAIPTLKTFFESLQRIETFPADEYARKLEQASRYTPAMGQFAQYFPQPDQVSEQRRSMDRIVQAVSPTWPLSLPLGEWPLSVMTLASVRSLTEY